MASVNLYNTEEQLKRIENTRGLNLNTLFFSLGIIVLSLGAYGGMRFWEMSVDKKIEEVSGKIQALQAELTTISQETNEIFDTHLRLKGIGEESKPFILGSFSAIEQNILKGVLLSDYKYAEEMGKNEVILKGDAENANALSQQVERFRSAGKFSDVQLESVGLSKEGYVLFTIRLEFKG